MNGRLLYIDKLRALAMMLVVMGHTIYFCMYHEEQFNDSIFNIICSFHVPLFFFLSGVVITNPPTFKKFLSKAKKFLFPFFIVGFINALLIGKVYLFFFNGGHNGYWYLLTLTIFYLMSIPFQLNKNESRITSLFIDVFIALTIWFLFYLSMRLSSTVFDALNPWGAFSFWPFFIIGYISRKYKIVDIIVKTPAIALITTFIYLLIVIILFSRLNNLPIILDFMIALLAIVSLLGLFSKWENSNTWLDRQLLFIGNHTLEIYIYHYFLIRFINLEFLKGYNSIFVLVFITILTPIITYVSMGIGWLVSRIITRAYYLKNLMLTVFLMISLNTMADSYDANNYPPKDKTILLTETNLPIVFIHTQQQAIHRDYRIAARMKIINNEDGINYGDTLAHPNQTVDYDGWIAIRYRGNTSFDWSDKKSYNFKTMQTDDPNGEKKKSKLLGMPKDNTWVLLAPYIDKSLLRDVLVFQQARPYFEYTPRCKYCEIVLDGLYYGIYILTENIRKGENRLNLDDPGEDGDALTGGYQLQIDRDDEEHYTSKYLAIDSLGRTYSAYNKIYLQYKHPDYDDLLPIQKDYIIRQIDLMEDALASEDYINSETGYIKYLDELSFIDQQLSQEFSGNVDGYRLSTNIYKRRDSQDSRFKTALWDFDLAFGNSSNANATGTDFWRYQNSYFTNYNAYNKVPFWWMRLMDNPAYVKRLKDRWAQYRQENYSNKQIEATIDSITTLLSEKGALDRNNTAWNMLHSTTYDMEIDKLKSWIARRVAWMDEQLENNNIESGIERIKTDKFNKQITGYYNLQGIRIEKPGKGIVIVSYQDGSYKKIRL